MNHLVKLKGLRIYNFRSLVFSVFILISSFAANSQQVKVVSPNQKIMVGLFNPQNNLEGNWYLKITCIGQDKSVDIIPQVNIGLLRNDQEFSNNLKFLKAEKPLIINEQYSVLHGKKLLCSNSANEVVVSFENTNKEKLNLILRVYNDGVAFRYEFPGKGGTYVVKDELTSYIIPSADKRWMERFDLSNEALYKSCKNDSLQGNWGYPALFNSTDNDFWFLLHEADVNRSYCASKLSNKANKPEYKITFPESWEGNGESQPTITLPWKSPWRVVIAGSLTNILESTLVDDVSPSSVISNTDWIKPGIVSWNYWSNNHGTKDYKVACEFADLAAAMGWPYTLLDWEWDQMGNGGNLEDAIKYIHSKGVKPLMWYNSGVASWAAATPIDRMLTHEKRLEEFTKLTKLGVAGIKVDFFVSEKQQMIKYYLDIIDDAAQFNIMVYFHGCLVPRGWARTYPHVMTYEGVHGAEWYNNGPEFTAAAPEHNTILPFTRNVVGSMDYTPVTFTNSQYPHITSYGHELALSVVFESGFQHMADRTSGYYELPDAPKSFLKEVPNTWDKTKLLEGYPGREVIIARQKGNRWYIGGINGENIEKVKTLKFDFLQENTNYKLTLIADGNHDKDFAVKYIVVNKSSSVEVKILRRGGFAASLVPIQK